MLSGVKKTLRGARENPSWGGLVGQGKWLRGAGSRLSRRVQSFLHGIGRLIAYFDALNALFRLSNAIEAMRGVFRAAWPQIGLSSMLSPGQSRPYQTSAIQSEIFHSIFR